MATALLTAMIAVPAPASMVIFEENFTQTPPASDSGQGPWIEDLNANSDVNLLTVRADAPDQSVWRAGRSVQDAPSTTTAFIRRSINTSGLSDVQFQLRVASVPGNNGLEENGQFADRLVLRYSLDGLDFSNSVTLATGDAGFANASNPGGSDFSDLSVNLSDIDPGVDDNALFALQLESVTSFVGEAYDFDTLTVTAVPEPATLLLIGMTGGGAAAWRRRRRS